MKQINVSWLRVERVSLILLVLIYAVAYAFLATNRKIEFDTAVYLEFYDTIKISSNNYSNCLGFEPIFCYGSKILTLFEISPFMVHTVWSFIIVLLTLIAILRFDSSYIARTALLLIPLTINFFNPTEVFFLTRQFLAGAFLLNFFVSSSNTGRILWGGIAFFSHFFCLPLIMLFILSNHNIVQVLRKNYVIIILASIIACVVFAEELNLVRATLEYKLLHYQDKNDGGVSALSEVKFIIYFGVAYYLTGPKVRIFLIYCFAFYLMTFLNPLAHLRYHKYFYFIFMFCFLHSVRVQYGFFIVVVSLLTVFRFNSIVKWLSNGFGVEYMIKQAFRYLLG